MEICPYCESHKRLPLITIKPWTIIKCNNCGLAFTKLPPKYNVKKFNRAHYLGNYLSSCEKRKGALEKRFLKRLNEIETVKKGGNILDVGCSTGLFLRAVDKHSKYKWKLFGIDINNNSIRFAKTKVRAELSCTSLHKMRFKKNFIDCVTCFDVLEHDVDIKSNLKEIYRILKPGGLLVIQAPNYKSVMTYFCGKHWDWWSVPDHVLHFCPTVLSNILSDSGFVIKKLFTWEPAIEFVTNVRGTMKAKIVGFMGLNRVVSKLASIPLYIFWVILQLIESQMDIGGLIVVYAIKK